MSGKENNMEKEDIRTVAATRRCRGLKVKDVMQILTQLLLPLILAVFTIVVTFDQRNENRIQRLEDRRLAEQQRLQDLNISHQQRLEDRELAREQREQDMNISREQRENDKLIAEEQRKHDKQIAAEKRAADDLNAEIQRNMTRDQRMYEINIEQERYRKDQEKYLDNLLLSYYNEVGELLQRTNGTSFFLHPIIFSLVRAKTLNVIEQVGPKRAVHLIMFLYGAGQLTLGERSLDLTEGHLNDIDFRTQRSLANIYLVRTYLNRASFDGRNLSFANFQGAQLVNASFRGAICIGTRFDDAQMTQADFNHADITQASFTRTNLQSAVFRLAVGHSPLFQYSQMQRGDFSYSYFTYKMGEKGGFIDSNLAQSRFHRANLTQIRFLYCNLTYTDFTYADLRMADLRGSQISYSSFVEADLGSAMLFSANLSYANLSSLKCSGTIRNVSSCRLHQSLSTANAHLPSSWLGVLPKQYFTEKDHPYCLEQVIGESFPFRNDSQWKIEPPQSVVSQYQHLYGSHITYPACVLKPRTTGIIVNMTRIIDLEIHDQLVQDGRALAAIRCLVGHSARIGITELRKNETKLETDEWVAYRWFKLLKHTTTKLEVTLQFLHGINSSWFYDLQLEIYPDIRAPDTPRFDSR